MPEYEAIQKAIDKLYTQHKLASALGVSEQTVSTYRKMGMPVALILKGDLRNIARFSLDDAKEWISKRRSKQPASQVAMAAKTSRKTAPLAPQKRGRGK